MSEGVSYQERDGVATITMDDGKVNALSPRMLADINAALDRAVADEAVVVLTGRPGVFSAGLDLPTLRAGGDDQRAMLVSGFELAVRMLSFPTPVVIACTGHAIAMAAFLLLSGDYRIGAEGPYKITANEVAIAFILPRAAIEICRQRLAPADFSRATMLSDVFAPDRAAAAGFLDRTVPPHEVMDAAHEVASQLRALDMVAHHATKLRVREQALIAIKQAIELDYPAPAA